MEPNPGEQQEEMATEVKRLESSIRIVTSSFNGDFTELQQQCQCLLREIHVNELYQVLLIDFVFQSDDKVYKASNLYLKEQFELDNLRQHVTVDLDKVSLAYEKVKMGMLQKLNEDKMLDKSFRKRLQQANGGVIDQETLNLLYQMFRQRNLKIMSLGSQVQNKRCPRTRGLSAITLCQYILSQGVLNLGDKVVETHHHAPVSLLTR